METTFAPADFSDDALGIQQTGYVQTSSFARVVFLTSETSFTLKTLSDQYPAYSGENDAVSVWCNGLFIGSYVSTLASTYQNFNITIPAGSNKKVELVAGGSGSSAQTGTKPVSVTTTNAITILNPVSRRLIIYGDSIASGFNCTVPTREAWVVKLRNFRGSIYSTLSLSYGGRALFSDGPDASSRTSFVNAIAALNPNILWLSIGTNDNTYWSSSSFQTAYEDFLTKLHATMPNLVIYAQTPFNRTDDISAFRTAIANAVSGKEAWCTLIDGTAAGWPTLGDLNDGIHPTTAGHQKVFKQVAIALGELINPLPSTA